MPRTLAPAGGVAFIFDGETGLGKTAAAYCLAGELGCDTELEELGGMHEIPSGEQDVESVRGMLNLLRLRPLFGSGWKVIVVNEADRMSRLAEMVWLDGSRAPATGDGGHLHHQ